MQSLHTKWSTSTNAETATPHLNVSLCHAASSTSWGQKPARVCMARMLASSDAPAVAGARCGVGDCWWFWEGHVLWWWLWLWWWWLGWMGLVCQIHGLCGGHVVWAVLVVVLTVAGVANYEFRRLSLRADSWLRTCHSHAPCLHSHLWLTVIEFW